MKTKSSDDDGRRHRRAATAIKTSLRDLRIQLALLNHQVGRRLALKDIDLDCLDVLAKDGPMTPSALARRVDLHPATLTGILDRLERGGWIARGRDSADRRSVSISVLPDRNAEVYRLYRGMNSAMDKVCAGYTVAELGLISDFLQRSADAGRESIDTLDQRS